MIGSERDGVKPFERQVRPRAGPPRPRPCDAALRGRARFQRTPRQTSDVRNRTIAVHYKTTLHRKSEKSGLIT